MERSASVVLSVGENHAHHDVKPELKPNPPTRPSSPQAESSLNPINSHPVNNVAEGWLWLFLCSFHNHDCGGSGRGIQCVGFTIALIEPPWHHMPHETS